jgi:molecular chaperone DnaK (HSP70)
VGSSHLPAGDLAVDYGTSNTVALIRSADGRIRQLLFDASPLLASAVYAERDGTLYAGRDAVRAARLDPTRYEPNPKRRIDDRDVLLGTRAYPVVELIAATLRLVRDETVRTVGQIPGRVVLTHPASWGSVRRGVLVGACLRAGLSDPVLVAEPVGAATYFAGLPETRLAPGQAVVVYDLGAGTFDASVVRWTGAGFETLAYRGLDDIGGLDVDALLVAHAGGVAAGQAEAWQRVIAPKTIEDRRHHRLLWDDAREAKESLSRQNRASFPLPVVGGDVMVTRAEFEAMVRPLLTRTVAETLAAIRESRVRPDHVAGLFLVGGGSRIPLVATLLHQRCGIAPTALEQPELVVADGALTAVSARTSEPPRPATAASRVAAVSDPPLAPAPPRVGTPLPPEQAWPSAPPTGPPQGMEPPRGLDRPARTGPPRPQDQPQAPPTPARPPVWPAEATGGASPHRGRRPPKLVWGLILVAIAALIIARIEEEGALGLLVVAVIGLLVFMAVSRRRRRLRR